MVAGNGSTLGFGVLAAQEPADPRQELVFLTIHIQQLCRALNARLAQLTQCGCTPSGLIVDLESGCTDPFFSLPPAADFAFLCNGASEDSERGAELRERPRYEYGPGLEEPHYGLPSPYYNYLESEYGNPETSFPRRVPSSEFHGSPLHHGPARSPPRYLPSQAGEYWRQSSAFPPRLCPWRLPHSSHPARAAPGLEQALFLGDLSQS